MARATLTKKIARLEAELKETKAEANRAKRKERNKQLMAFGIHLEQLYKEQDAEGREKMRSQLESAALNERVKLLALDGFTRLDEQTPAPVRLNSPGQGSGKASGD